MLTHDTIQARSLIIDGRNELIVPTKHERLTFSSNVDPTQETDERSLHDIVEKSLMDDYDMPSLVTRRYLGEVGVTRAFILTPWQGKTLNRTFAWQRRTIDSITDQVIRRPDNIDPVDVDIYTLFLDFKSRGELGG